MFIIKCSLYFLFINNFVTPNMANGELLLTINWQTKLLHVNFLYYLNPHFKHLTHRLNSGNYCVYWCHFDHCCIQSEYRHSYVNKHDRFDNTQEPLFCFKLLQKVFKIKEVIFLKVFYCSLKIIYTHFQISVLPRKHLNVEITSFYSQKILQTKYCNFRYYYRFYFYSLLYIV